jgi:hypothetical protein
MTHGLVERRGLAWASVFLALRRIDQGGHVADDLVLGLRSADRPMDGTLHPLPSA